MGCPLNARLMELLATQVEGMSRAEYLGAGEQLRRAGWLSRDREAYSAHDVTLEAVPEDENRFHKFLEWARDLYQRETGRPLGPVGTIRSFAFVGHSRKPLCRRHDHRYASFRERRLHPKRHNATSYYELQYWRNRNRTGI